MNKSGYTDHVDVLSVLHELLSGYPHYKPGTTTLYTSLVCRSYLIPILYPVSYIHHDGGE